MTNVIEDLKHIVGPDYVITEDEDIRPYLTDRRKRFQGAAQAIVFPANTAQISAVAKLCNQRQIPIVTQGGNTGLVLGSVPDQIGNAIVLSTRRLHGVLELDEFNHTITVGAGSTLADVQKWAAEKQCFFPLSLASEGSCTIGGNLASNAGGTAVLHYGNTRDLCLGLEVVLANGEVWQNLKGLRKDNTGYDLRDMFIGSEGTLGIITAAVMKLYPAVRSTHVAWLELNSLEEVLAIFHAARKQLHPWLTGFELLSDDCISLVAKHFPHIKGLSQISRAHAYAVLLEVSDTTTADFAYPALIQLLEQLASEFDTSGWQLAQNEAQTAQFWAIRESISDAQAKEGPNIKHDISLPISQIPSFHRETQTMLQISHPDAKVICFGHIGDGNLHYNISTPFDNLTTSFTNLQASINRLVHDQVSKFKGSISAEHGIGMLKRDELLRYKSPVEISLMKAIKRAFDPYNILNPGKILHETETFETKSSTQI